MISSSWRRVRWQADLLAFKDEPLALALLKYDMPRDRQPSEYGNLISSYIHGSRLHAPVLDIDVPVRLVPSTTPGHSHLYIDVPMNRTKMFVLLAVMYWVGLLEMGNFWWSLRRGGTFVRTPETPKTQAEAGKYSYGMFFKLRRR